jgi:hypothetical protein
MPAKNPKKKKNSKHMIRWSEGVSQSIIHETGISNTRIHVNIGLLSEQKGKKCKGKTHSYH